jgi:spermidine/putrescine transport system ATP-binding protein
MADTIAVMNSGRIEQLGAPAVLYEWPATTFVANFLGQSNLLRTTVTGGAGDALELEVQGNRLVVPKDRAGAETTPGPADLLVGVRPEKIRLCAEDAPPPDGANALRGGVVSDVSFTGVSTQYLVRMPWGQELMVFAQNAGTAALQPVGARVVLCWEPAHSFRLPADQDAEAGVTREETTDVLAVG